MSRRRIAVQRRETVRGKATNPTGSGRQVPDGLFRIQHPRQCMQRAKERKRVDVPGTREWLEDLGGSHEVLRTKGIDGCLIDLLLAHGQPIAQLCSANARSVEAPASMAG